MLTVKQASAALGVSATCVYQLVARGRLACHRIGLGRGAIRISESDLEAYIEGCRQKPQPRPASVHSTPVKRMQLKHLRLEE